MTVRPENYGQKIHVNFLVFRTQPTVDELSVYDGLSTSSSLIGHFSGFELPDSITATNPDGALTFTFVSSEYVNFSGWVAKLTCTGGESINEDSSVKTKVYPNPCQNSFTIEAEGDMHYSLYDCLGQRIVSGTFKEETQISTTDLQPGIYFLQLNGEQNCCVEKLVIEK